MAVQFPTSDAIRLFNEAFVQQLLEIWYTIKPTVDEFRPSLIEWHAAKQTNPTIDITKLEIKMAHRAGMGGCLDVLSYLVNGHPLGHFLLMSEELINCVAIGGKLAWELVVPRNHAAVLAFILSFSPSGLANLRRPITGAIEQSFFHGYPVHAETCLEFICLEWPAAEIYSTVTLFSPFYGAIHDDLARLAPRKLEIVDSQLVRDEKHVTSVAYEAFAEELSLVMVVLSVVEKHTRFVACA